MRGFRQLKKRLPFWLFLGFLLLFLLRLKNYFSLPEDLKIQIDFDPPPKSGGKHYDKWIIITTVQSPTPTIRSLARLPGWKVVVVADLKTPSTWRVDGVKFLDIHEQKSLNYAVTRLLPYNNYARKMIGYLYAIQHGARYIYETDDDNNITDGLRGFQLVSSQQLMLRSSGQVFNSYAYFGQPSMWPRGFPLDLIGQSQKQLFSLKTGLPPAIQQGLANGDPDVDALYRLTRKPSSTRLNLHFDAAIPPVTLPEGTFSPFNSQNTLFTYQAFWAMYLPVTVTFRVCDIWRSYWGQRLLWLSGNHIGMFPPNDNHTRNEHDLAKDAAEETDLYQKSGELVRFLNKWQCTHEHFFSCVSDLTQKMATSGYWKWEETVIMEAWLSDLSMIGYAPPSLSRTKLFTDKTKSSHHIQIYANDQLTSFSHVPDLFKLPRPTVRNIYMNKCEGAQSIQNNSFSGALLVVAAKYTKYLELYEALYRGRFTNIVYCLTRGQQTDKAVSYIQIPSWNAVNCLASAVSMGYRVDNTIFVGEDTLVSGRRLAVVDQSHIWYTRSSVVGGSSTEAACAEANQCGQAVWKDVTSKMKKLLSTFGDSLTMCLGKLFLTEGLKGTLAVRDSLLALNIPKSFHKTIAHVLDAIIARDLPDSLVLPVLHCLDQHVVLLEGSSVKHQVGWDRLPVLYDFDPSKVVNDMTQFGERICKLIM